MSNNSKNFLNSFYDNYSSHFSNQKVILSFMEYLDKVKAHPEYLLRNSCSYLLDMFDHYGNRKTENVLFEDYKTFKIFDINDHQITSLIGNQRSHNNIINTLKSFKRRGQSFKLIVLHGPNGSSKSSTITSICNALNEYSHSFNGALYKFCWVFPKDKDLANQFEHNNSGSIGFSSSDKKYKHDNLKSFSKLDESKISCKLDSEYKENPIFLIPMPYRKEFIKSCFKDKYLKKENKNDYDDLDFENSLSYLFSDSLSKKNKEIFERLLKTYNGDIHKVFRHVQIERFYLSKHYRCGISCVEPQMSIDAFEKQLTMDRYMHNLPSILQTINFYQYSGALVEGNRGIIEFSDFLKRPLDHFKYLLSTIEKGSINLQSSSMLLDCVFFATTNDTHWDAFTQIPDFSSFRGRIHLTSVPYLLSINEEIKIYHQDVNILKKELNIAPHSLYILCLWAVMTRLKPCQKLASHSNHQKLLTELNPLNKAKIYNGQFAETSFTKEQKNFLKNHVKKIHNQYLNTNDYEGKYGASPRVIRDLLYRAAQNANDHDLSPWDIINEIQKLSKQKALYSFLRLPADKNYNHHDKFIEYLKKEALELFEKEFLEAMSMVESVEYEKLFSNYIDHVVGTLRHKKIYDTATSSYVEPSYTMMVKIENIINPQNTKDFRESLLSSMAAWKIDNPDKDFVISEVFNDLLNKLKNHFYHEKTQLIKNLCINIIKLSKKDTEQLNISDKDKKQVQKTMDNLINKFGYSETSILKSIMHLINYYKDK